MKKTKEQRKDEALKAYRAIYIPAYKIYEAIEGPAWETYKAKCIEIDEEIVEEINQAEVELNEKIEAMRDLPPPYPADKENPMKHIYQNEGYAKALEDILSVE